MDNDTMVIQLDEINIKSILRDLLKNCWVILLAAVSVYFLISGYYSLIYTPEYTSSATMVISAKGSSSNSTYTNLVTTTEMAGIFQDVFSSNILKKTVQEHINEELGEFSINSSVVSETNLMVISVTAETPKAAYLIINAVIEHHAEVSDYVFDNAVLDVLQSPRVPTVPSNRISISKYQKLGLLAGAFAAAAAIAFFSVMRETLKTEVQAARKLKSTCLATIKHEEKNKSLKAKLKHQNKAILITNPLVSFDYVESFRKLAFRLQYEMKKNNEKVVLVSSVSENEGKSTVAVNIALALVQAGKKVAVVDLDLRSPVIHKIFELSNDSHRGFWQESISLKGNQKLCAVMNNLPMKNPVAFIKKSGFHLQMEELKKEFDYIILDSSPMNVAADVEMMAAYADVAIFVARQDWVAINAINYNIDILEKTDVRFMGYVLNDFESGLPIGNKRYHHSYEKKYGKYGYDEHYNTGV